MVDSEVKINNIICEYYNNSERHSYIKAFLVAAITSAINFSIFLWIAFYDFSFGDPCIRSEFTNQGFVIILCIVILVSLFFLCYMIKETIYFVKQAEGSGKKIFLLWLDGIMSCVGGCILSLFPIPLIFGIVCDILNFLDHAFDLININPIVYGG